MLSSGCPPFSVQGEDSIKVILSPGPDQQDLVLTLYASYGLQKPSTSLSFLGQTVAPQETVSRGHGQAGMLFSETSGSHLQSRPLMKFHVSLPPLNISRPLVAF